MDLQTWVKCLQQDHTDIVPQCATFYNCGLTVLDAPRGRILQLSVIDKIDPDTHEESSAASDDYCSEITYAQINPCHIKSYLWQSRGKGCCLSIPLFFGIPYGSCGHAAFPIPTDEGLPSGLPVLPLGFHYPQTSTDSKHGRAMQGVWAIERGKIFVAPWIQSTESILLKWDGLKRTWSDQDPVDPDPQLSNAVEEYVRWQHASKYDRDDAESMRAAGAFNLARQTLIHECREETRIRECEPSVARGASIGFGTLFYNDEQKVTASCPAGQTGSSVTVTVPAGTVGSNKSVADANATAQAQAQTQAQARIVCTDIPATYTNTVEGDFTASCVTTDENAPAPTGTPVRVVIPIGTVSGDTQAEANVNAQQEAQDRAYSQLSGCVFYNSAQSYTSRCTSNPSIPVHTETVAANTYNGATQEIANQLALEDAKTEALAYMASVCTGDFGPTGDVVYNSIREVTVSSVIQYVQPATPYPGRPSFPGWTSGPVTVQVVATMNAGTVSGKTLNEANSDADSQLLIYANQQLITTCALIAGGNMYPQCSPTSRKCVFPVIYPAQIS